MGLLRLGFIGQVICVFKLDRITIYHINRTIIHE